MKVRDIFRWYWALRKITIPLTVIIIILLAIPLVWRNHGITIYVSKIDYHIDQPGNENVTITVALVFREIQKKNLTIKHIQIASLFTDEIGYQSVFQDFMEGDKLTIVYNVEYLTSFSHKWKIIICLGYGDFLEFEAVEGKEFKF